MGHKQAAVKIITVKQSTVIVSTQLATAKTTIMLSVELNAAHCASGRECCSLCKWKRMLLTIKWKRMLLTLQVEENAAHCASGRECYSLCK